MTQTQIACPRCRQMISADVQQLFDVSANPQDKQRLLSGQVNYARCPHCGYQGRLATPIVYHDNDKELLLTFFPMELGMPINEQERMIGPLIKQVTDRLPPEKRKAYLFNPQANLTYESMLETILGKDGVTPEMLKSQQDRMHLIETLMQIASKEARSELIKQNTALVDEIFFALFSRIAQSAIASGQEQAARMLIDIQTQLLDETDYGRQLKESVGELEAAQQALQDVGDKLTIETFLDLVVASKSDARLKAYVSLARGGMDYAFFQKLTERVEKESGEEKTRLENIREKLLGFIAEADKQNEARMKQAQELVESLLAESDIEKAVSANLDKFTQESVDFAQQALRQATEKNEYERMGKLQKLIQVLQAASAPPEIALIEQLIQLPDAATVEQALNKTPQVVTQELLDALAALMGQMESQSGGPEAKAMAEKINEIYKVALKISMKRNMN